MKISVMLTVLATLLSLHRTLAQDGSVIETTMKEAADVFTVECYAYERDDGIVQAYYGLWELEPHLRHSVNLVPVDSRTSSIQRHFVWQVKNVHQAFPVFIKSGLVLPCGDVCRWTVNEDGFYLSSPKENNLSTLIYDWINGTDGWIPPVSD